jgi:histidinol dehydrogenase
MRLVYTQGRGGKQTRQMLGELELRGARSTARAMPVVERFVGDVGKGGDHALRRYASKLDGLAPHQRLVITLA